MKFKPDDKVTMNVKTIEVTQNGIHESVKEVQMSSKDYKKELDTVIHVEVLHASLEGYFIEKLHIDKDNLFGCIVYNTKNSIITILVYTIMEGDAFSSNQKLLDECDIHDEYIDGLIRRSKYEDKKIGNWNCKEDVDKFFKENTYENGWGDLKIGNWVTIKDGTYNKNWVIAGFNCETAIDGKPGGIVFIPRYNGLDSHAWNFTDTLPTPYKDSNIHAFIDVMVYNNLYNILGDHIVQRNVTLGNECKKQDPRNNSTSDTCDTIAYLTLMSCAQLLGPDCSHNNSMDDGEANYKLPLFNFISIMDYTKNKGFWLRNIWGSEDNNFFAWRVYTDGNVYRASVDSPRDVRPLMYLR